MSEITSQNNVGALTSSTIVNSGEVLNAAIVGSNEDLTVLSGGSAVLVVVSGGVEYISGGRADSTVILSGTQYVSGGNVDSVVIHSGAEQYIYGGVVSNVTADGNQYVSGGSVGSVGINSGAEQYIYDGVVSNVTVDGTQYVSGGSIHGVFINSSAVQYMYGGSVSYENVYGTQYLSGGSIRGVFINSGAVQYMYGGSVSYETVDGTQYVSSGNIGEATLGIDATQYVFSGGQIMSDATVYYGATQYVYGGTVNNVSMVSIFTMYLSNYIASTGDDGSWLKPQIQYVASGGIVNNIEMQEVTTSQWLYTYHYDVKHASAAQYVGDGGTVNGGSIVGGTQYIAKGGIVNDINLIQRTGYSDFEESIDYGFPEQYVSGGVANRTVISGGNQYVSDEGVSKDTVLIGGGQTVSIGGIASHTVISGGNQYVSFGGVATDTVMMSGSQVIYSGGVASNMTFSAGTISVCSGGKTVGNLILSSGGYLSIANGGTLEGDVTLSKGGSMTIGMSNGGSVDLIGDQNSGLVISGYTSGVDTSVTTVISGFSGLMAMDGLSDKVTVDGLQANNVSSVAYPDADHITLQLLDGTSLTLNMIGIKYTGVTLGSDASGDLTMIVCFLSGTLIKMAKGVCAVEDLQVGDMVLTYDPQSKAKVKKKITWVGKQTAHVNAKLPDDQAGYPVRILKDAFKKNVPNKDLLITSEHCLFIDGHFVPARMLVNGRSIFYDYSITSYDYYHVETEDHSVIWADGMLTESYLNTGNRHSFNKDQKVVQLDPHVKIWAEDA
ncbi:Hint domain-containing protein, partial [Commensalibacter intestini]|uniref:Hint domain-containing protein n=1 Tax=Commensalibacter intestini TaxID=479936 RepID=UPI001478BEC6